METRKQREAEFHNKIRGKELKKGAQEYKHLTSNRKFYSITRKSREFVNKFLIENCSGKKTLDYCCGDGQITIFLAENDADAFGIDISSVSIENCKREAARKGLEDKTHFLVMDAENLDFEDDYFDLIVCVGVLHHLDIKKVYPELARVLKPDGKIICNEPLVYNPFFQLYRKLTPHLRTKWEIEHILSKNDIKLAKKHFGKVKKFFFHLTTLLAVSFRNLPIVFNPLLTVLEYLDSIILKIPLIKWLSWQAIFILSHPKKK